MERMQFIRYSLLVTGTFLLLFSTMPITDRSNDVNQYREDTVSEESRGEEGLLNLPAWNVGNYWTFRRYAHCIDSEGYEYDQWDNRTLMVATVSEIYTGYGSPVECYNLTLTGDVRNYREAEMDTAEYGFDFGVVPYKTVFTGTVSGYLLLERSTLATVQEFKAMDGSAYVYDLEPALLNTYFEGTYDFWDLNYLNYTPAMKDFTFPHDSGDSFHTNTRIDFFTKSYLDIEGGQTRYNSLYYTLEDDVVVSTEEVGMNEEDAYKTGDTLRCMKLVYTNNGGAIHSDDPNCPDPPQGGTRTAYLSPETGWFARYTYTNHVGTLSSGYIMESTEYLKETNYAGRDPVVEEVEFDAENVTNSGEDSVLLTAVVFDPDGSLDIEKVEADLSGLNVGLMEMLDDGTGVDETAGDGVFSLLVDIADSVNAGAHLIEVTVYDLNGNTGTNESTLTVLVKNEPPNVFSGFTSPTTLYNDGVTEVKFTAEVDDPNGAKDIASVTCDLQLLGGDADASMLDDGTGGDDYSGDGKYTVLHTIPITVTSDTYSVVFTATDGGNEIGTLAVDVVVYEFIPVIAPTIVKAKSVPEEAFVEPDLEILLTVEVEDGNGLDTIVSVEGDLTEIGGDDEQMFNDDGSRGDEKADDGEFSYRASIDEDILADEGVKDKVFSIPVIVTDDTYETATCTINITLAEPNSPPSITSASASIDSIFNDGKEEVTVTVEIMDNDTLADLVGAWIDLSTVGGSEMELETDDSDIFKWGDYEYTFTVPSSVKGGTYKITIRVEDSEGNTDTHELEIEVVNRPGVGDDDDDTGDDDTGDDDTTDDDNPDDDDISDDDETGGRSEKKGSPGFSVLFVIGIVGLLLVVKRRWMQ